MQATIQSLQTKVATLENTIQSECFSKRLGCEKDLILLNTLILNESLPFFLLLMLVDLTLQQHGQHQQPSNTTPPSGSSSSSSTPTMSTGPLAVNPYATNPMSHDLQHKFNRLQHSHGEEKMRNLTLRENLKDLFGYLQVPVASSAIEGMHANGGGESGGKMDWNAVRIDDYVQALRDAVVGPVNASPSTVRVLDTKRRDTIVDKVLSMYH